MTATYEPDQLAEMLRILPGVDAVELKLTVPNAHHRGVIQRLGIDSIDAVVRQIAFIDTADLRLAEAGLAVRARRTQRKPADVTVKLRPMLPADAPAGLRKLPGFKIELDASPKGFVCSCSLTAEAPDHEVRDLFRGSGTVMDVLSDAQRSMLLDRMPRSVDPGDLRVMGPVHILKVKFAPADFPRKMVGELWFLPDGGRILELSTKSPPSAAFQAAAEAKVFLSQHGVDLGAPQEMKTRSTLAALAATPDKES